MSDFTHFDSNGASRMVDVGDKPITHRLARATATVVMLSETQQQIEQGMIGKGNVLEAARLAGIMAAKRTDELIPLCHSLGLDGATVDFSWSGPGRLQIVSAVRVQGRTGVEMEALVAASVAALTVYDMCKSSDRGMEISAVRLLEKSGGRSGHYVSTEGRSDG